MADTIPGQQIINVGLPNESTGSDSLYTAFNKAKTNFATLFTNASPYNTFNPGVGIGVNSNANTGTVTITNTGVTNIIAGTNIVIDQSNGNVTISSTGGGNGNGGGTVTSVGITPASISRLTVSGVANNTVTSNGIFTLDLATTGVTSGTYTYPTVTVDNYGRVTGIANANSVGTVTSVSVIPGDGIQVTGSPITTTGNITVTNTGVTRLNAGTGILLSGSNGNVTVSASLTGGTVTSVGVQSNTLNVTGSPVTTTGIVQIELPNSITLSGNLTLPTGNIIYTPRYGAFYSNVTQTNPVANTAMAMTINNTFGANGVSVVSNSRLTVAKAGVYNIQFSAQVTKTDAGTDSIEIWLSKNGNTVPWTNTRLLLSGSGELQPASWNFVESLAANEYVQIMWASADLAAQIEAVPAASTVANVAIPSVIVTVTPVGA